MKKNISFYMHLLVFVLFSGSLEAQVGLTKAAATKMSTLMISEIIEAQKEKAAASWAKGEINIKDKKLKFAYHVFGDKPVDGRSLYISMHGGGNTESTVNDQQWENQFYLYRPSEGVYVAPRAPTNTWNLWHEDHVDDFFEQLIKDAIIMEDVNPNKVYIMGYSAGGDGTFQLAPRMADYWAAASMMAGHPGDASALGLRNLPFSIFMGGADDAYQRNEHAVSWGEKLDSLQKTAPGFYIHDVHVFPGMPHWMDRKDSIAMPWMAKFKRNPLPTKVVWHQDDRLRSRFYWLGLPEEGMIAHAETIVSILENTITIEKNDNPTLYIYLNDRMLNLDKKVKVVYKGTVIFNKKIKRTSATISETAKRIDKDLIFYSRLTLKNGQVIL
ncbi:hypothetical protein [Pedobacter nutrimenti]|uniref:hypothetical protein n=1 Tax=Pedobacter nutrimenti TaxID=1241337 RepID=UPI002930ACAE|nr:hypothetical protein [Pedobacter nutrimenti]